MSYELDPSEATEENADCDNTNDIAGGTGLFNIVSVSDGDTTRTDTACSELPFPEIDVMKMLAEGPTASQAIPNRWSVSYDVIVKNTGTGKGSYWLSDTFNFSPAVTPTVDSVTHMGDGMMVNVNDAGFDGIGDYNVLTDTAMLDSMSMDTFRIYVSYDLDPSEVTEENADCDETNDIVGGTGLFNIVSVYDGDTLRTDTACTELPSPELTINKMLGDGGLVRDGINTWNVTYKVTVTNEGDGKGWYDLSDTLKYGDGATVDSVDVLWMGDGMIAMMGDVQDSLNAGFDGESDYEVVDSVMLEGGEMDMYNITVYFTIDPSEIGQCGQRTAYWM